MQVRLHLPLLTNLYYRKLAAHVHAPQTALAWHRLRAHNLTNARYFLVVKPDPQCYHISPLAACVALWRFRSLRACRNMKGGGGGRVVYDGREGEERNKKWARREGESGPVVEGTAPQHPTAVCGQLLYRVAAIAVSRDLTS